MSQPAQVITPYLHDPEAPPSSLSYVFGGAEPVASLAAGSVLSTWTWDCFVGRIQSSADRVSENCDPRMLNPQTGPFFIDGAKPGDALAIHFVTIEPRNSWGVSATVPFFGALTTTHLTAGLQSALPELTWYYEIDRAERLVRYSALDSPYTADLPLDPMHGTVGVAPALGEVRSSLAPGDWGGNMDTPEMRAGTTCYLPVNVEGALFSFGDGHARQGEGEACGVAVECAMDTVLIVDVVRGQTIGWPRLEDDQYLMTTGSARPLEDALRIAHTELVNWTAELTGLSIMDAYQLVSQTALTPVANAVDTTYTVVAKLPKAILKLPPAMSGMHQRMRRSAAAVKDNLGSQRP
ncbi:acetamidase/formamidase family protein [Jatrophihabitans sp. DSM 45814]